MKQLIHLFFPNYCPGCGQTLSRSEKILCIKCLNDLPQTTFHLLRDNPVSHLFTGRVDLYGATSCYFFHKGSVLQNIIHQFKYKGRKDIAWFMGNQMGEILERSVYFKQIDCIVPVPLYILKEKKRGYNQAAMLAGGMAEIFSLPVIKDAVKRVTQTDTQTHLNRQDRWQNVKTAFKVVKSEKLEGRHVLLVDDVITTGATLEACAASLSAVNDIRISLVTLAVAK